MSRTGWQALEIESIEFFYLREPQVRDIGDGSQDALLVRVRGGGHEGWGECEASPLASIAAWCAPMSHAACHPVEDVVRGSRIDTPDDIRGLNRRVREACLDLRQAPHTLSGVDTALWDLLARRHEVSVPELLGLSKRHPKLAYASVLFGDTAEQTEERARACRADGFRSAKFGWGGFGTGSLENDVRHLEAARAGLGADAELLVDAGTIWRDDVKAAAARLPALRGVRAGWLEEPFVGGALGAYRALGQCKPSVRLAAGEGATSQIEVEQLIEFAGLDFVQVDTGRIGGLSTARDVALMAKKAGVEYVNHTFTSNLALAASLAPYWDDAGSQRCEFPTGLSPLAAQLTIEHISPSAEGFIEPPMGPGLGVRPDPEVLKRYVLDVHIEVAGLVSYRTSILD